MPAGIRPTIVAVPPTPSDSTAAVAVAGAPTASMQWSTPPSVSARIAAATSPAPASTKSVAPSRAATACFSTCAVDRDDAGRAGQARALDGAQADAAAADHRDGLAGPHHGPVEHRAEAGRDAAAEQRGEVERHLRRDPHGRRLVHEQLLREARHVQELVHLGAAAVQPRRLARRARRVRRRAQVRAAPQAAVAAAAGRRQAGDDVVAGREAVDLAADLEHHAGRLVAEDGRPRDVEHAAQVVEVAVAQAGGRGRDQQLVRADPPDVDVLDAQALGALVQHCSLHPVLTPPSSTARAGRRTFTPRPSSGAPGGS